MRDLRILLKNNQSTADDEWLFIDNNPIYGCKELKLELEMNSAGQLKAIIPRNHSAYNFDFGIIKTCCYVYFSGYRFGSTIPFWGGRLYSMQLDLYGNKTLVFEGMLSRLSMMVCPYDLLCTEKGKTSGNTLWNTLLYISRAYVIGGNVTASVTGRETCGTENTGRLADTPENIREKVIKLTPTLEVGCSLLDALTETLNQVNSSSTTTKYRIGQGGATYMGFGIVPISDTYEEDISVDMVTSYEALNSAEPFANRVYAISNGYESFTDEKDDWQYHCTLPYAAYSDGDYTHPEGAEYLEYNKKVGGKYVEGSVGDCGVVAKIIQCDLKKKATADESVRATQEKLKTLAKGYLTKSLKNLQSYKVSIVDRYSLDGDYTHFYVGEKVRFRHSDLPNFTATITARTYDLLNPLNDDIVIEKSRKKLTDIM